MSRDHQSVLSKRDKSGTSVVIHTYVAKPSTSHMGLYTWTFKNCQDMTNASSTYLGIVIGAVIGGIISWWIYNRQNKTSEKQDLMLSHIKELDERHDNVLKRLEESDKRHDSTLNAIEARQEDRIHYWKTRKAARVDSNQHINKGYRFKKGMG